jgi:CheY-like chemotaxis protein
LLAGQKLLLADDSITIQKVVDLTFADEGVNVVCVSNGRDAIERLEEFAPDIVIADVFMPQINGYEVCEYIKQNDKLKHIPVMLLVGSFEPFDEAEARRVGADDTLTKPFQSIRSLIDKVGLLVSRRQPEEEAPTAELPKPDITPEPEKLSEQEIEFTTADTQRLPLELAHLAQEWAPPRVKAEGVAPTSETKVDDQTMESNFTETSHKVYEQNAGEADILLDLGDFEPGRSSGEEFHLDLDLNEGPEPATIENALPSPAFAATAGYEADAGDWSDSSPVRVDDEILKPIASQSAITEEFQRPGIAPYRESAVEPTLREAPLAEEQAQPQQQPGGMGAYELSLDRLSPEVIDAIARRAVEHLSEKVVQEIAWEVVPQLAELLIKRQLEEKNS